MIPADLTLADLQFFAMAYLIPGGIVWGGILIGLWTDKWQPPVPLKHGKGRG